MFLNYKSNEKNILWINIYKITAISVFSRWCFKRYRLDFERYTVFRQAFLLIQYSFICKQYFFCSDREFQYFLWQMAGKQNSWLFQITRQPIYVLILIILKLLWDRKRFKLKFKFSVSLSLSLSTWRKFILNLRNLKPLQRHSCIFTDFSKDFFTARAKSHVSLFFFFYQWIFIF